MSSEQIFPGQVYVSCDPAREGVRIKVVGWPTGIGPGRVEVVTLVPSTDLSAARVRNRRTIRCSSLHDHRLTRNDGPRRSGYSLDQDAG